LKVTLCGVAPALATLHGDVGLDVLESVLQNDGVKTSNPALPQRVTGLSRELPAGKELPQ
jgi:hypothetical protein